jgi:hypothetical protein
MQKDSSNPQFANTNICAHLKPVEDYLRAQGCKVIYVGQPWSHNCHIWVYFENVVIDAEAIKSKLKLPEFVTIHTHRGTVDGAEHGLVCQMDQDAVMGVHPELAGDLTRRIS